MRDEARVCDEEGALVLVLGEGKLEKGEPSGLEGAAMRLKRKQGVNAILLRGLLLLRLRAGRPIPIVVLGLVLGAEKGTISNVSRALAPAGCAGRAGVAAVIFGGVRMGAPELVDLAHRRRHRRDPLQDHKCVACELPHPRWKRCVREHLLLNGQRPHREIPLWDGKELASHEPLPHHRYIGRKREASMARREGRIASGVRIRESGESEAL